MLLRIGKKAAKQGNVGGMLRTVDMLSKGRRLLAEATDKNGLKPQGANGTRNPPPHELHRNPGSQKEHA